MNVDTLCSNLWPLFNSLIGPKVRKSPGANYGPKGGCWSTTWPISSRKFIVFRL